MADKQQLEFFLLRYMPDAVKGEFVNFGVMALTNGPDGMELIDVRMMKDWGRVLCLDPQADLDVLFALEKEVRQEIGQTKDQVTLLKKMEDSFSNLVQISPVMPALAERATAIEIDDVAKMFLETPKLRRTREPAGRRKILETMHDEFEKAGVLALLNAVPAEPYTRPGDPFEFDFGYRFGGEIKLFQAVSMRASVDSAVMLAARYPKIVPIMARITSAAPMLTAVVENAFDRARSEVGFALAMMEESKIKIVPTSDMEEIAKRTRVELRA